MVASVRTDVEFDAVVGSGDLPALRRAAGVAADVTDYDSELRQAAEAAQSIASDYVGYSLGPAVVSDFFSCFATRMILSHRIDGMDVTEIRCWKDGGTVAGTVVSAPAHRINMNGETSEVLFPTALPKVVLSDLQVPPVRIQYSGVSEYAVQHKDHSEPVVKRGIIAIAAEMFSPPPAGVEPFVRGYAILASIRSAI